MKKPYGKKESKHDERWTIYVNGPHEREPFEVWAQGSQDAYWKARRLFPGIPERYMLAVRSPRSKGTWAEKYIQGKDEPEQKRDRGDARSLRRAFRISVRGGDSFTVLSTTPEKAAAIAVKKITRRRSAYAHRTTGTRGLSGMFQGYVSLKSGGASSVGPNFHVG